MKKKYSIIIMALFMLLSGCNNISKSEYDSLNRKYNTVVSNRDELLEEIHELEDENRKLEQLNEASDSNGMVKVVLSGGFSATVRSLIPNYAIHDERPLCAVVDLYQSGPFVVYLGDELISQVEEGKTYVFEIERTVVDMSQHEYKQNAGVEALIPLYNLRITSVRLANDDEIGISGAVITMTLAD